MWAYAAWKVITYGIILSNSLHFDHTIYGRYEADTPQYVERQGKTVAKKVAKRLTMDTG